MTPSPTGSPHGLLPLCSGCVYVASWFQSFQSLAKASPSMHFLANGPACFLLSSNTWEAASLCYGLCMICVLLPGVSHFESNPYCQGPRRWKFHLTVVFAEGATGRDLGLDRASMIGCWWLSKKRLLISHWYLHQLRAQLSRPPPHQTHGSCISEPWAKKTSFHYRSLSPNTNTSAAFLQPPSLATPCNLLPAPSVPKTDLDLAIKPWGAATQRCSR